MLYCWMQRNAPELEKRMLWYRKCPRFSGQLHETAIKVCGQRKRVSDQDRCCNLDCRLPHTRNTKAAKRFLAKARRLPSCYRPAKVKI